MKIVHWVPSSGERPSWKCVECWNNLEIPEGASKKFIRSLPGAIKWHWNRVCKDFLDTDADWLFSTHHDVVFDTGTLMRLLSWDKPLISALLFMRNSPVIPHIWSSEDKSLNGYVQKINATREWFQKHIDAVRFTPFVMEERPDDALVSIGFTSTACTLIHRSVLEGMRELIGDDWFLTDQEDGGGEDRRFFEYARAAGFESYVDRSCIAGHIVGDIATSSADFIAWDSVSIFQDQSLGTPAGDGEK